MDLTSNIYSMYVAKEPQRMVLASLKSVILDLTMVKDLWLHPEPGGTMPMRSFWNITLECTEHVILFDFLVSCTLWAANIKNQECLLNKWLFSDWSEWFSLLQLQGLHPVARLCRRSWSMRWCSQVWGFHYRIRDWARTLLAVCVSIFNLLYMVWFPSYLCFRD